MLNIKLKTAFENILEVGLSPTVIKTVIQTSLFVNLLLYFMFL